MIFFRKGLPDPENVEQFNFLSEKCGLSSTFRPINVEQLQFLT
jgi:hypothetical protein